MTVGDRTQQVRKNFGPTEIIRGVDLEIEPAKIHAIIGPNGAGKSTLFNLMTGLHPLTAGQSFSRARRSPRRRLTISPRRVSAAAFRSPTSSNA